MERLMGLLVTNYIDETPCSYALIEDADDGSKSIVTSIAANFLHECVHIQDSTLPFERIDDMIDALTEMRDNIKTIKDAHEL